MEMKWEDGFSIAVNVENNAVTISANKEGLLSLDEHNSLEENSCELIVEKTN